MFEWITASDFHIGSLRNVFADALHKQIVEIHKIYLYAIEHGIKYIVIPGDLTDTPTISDVELIELIRLFLKYDSVITTYYIAGNHDYYSVKKSSLSVLECLCEEGLLTNLHIMRKHTFVKIEGVMVNFVPFPNLIFPEHNKPYINFVHLDVDGAETDNGHIMKIDKDIDFGSNNITISGHNHKYQVIKSKRLVYCGNPYQKKFSEELPKGFIVCKAKYDGKKLKFDHTFVNGMPEFVLKTVTIKTDKDLQKLTANNNIAYKIIAHEGVVLPSNLGNKYNVTTVKSNFAAPVITGDYDKVNLRTGLKSYLVDCGLDDKQTKIAIMLVKEAILNLSLN